MLATLKVSVINTLDKNESLEGISIQMDIYDVEGIKITDFSLLSPEVTVSCFLFYYSMSQLFDQFSTKVFALNTKLVPSAQNSRIQDIFQRESWSNIILAKAAINCIQEDKGIRGIEGISFDQASSNLLFENILTTHRAIFQDQDMSLGQALGKIVDEQFYAIA